MMENSQALEYLTNNFKQLVHLLKEERGALEAHDAQLLEDITEQKRLICDDINQTLATHADLVQLIQSTNGESLENASSAGLDVGHKKLLDLVRSARDSNLVNGKILHRSQQSLREILGILSGKSFDGLYGQSGRQTSAPGSGTNAIASA